MVWEGRVYGLIDSLKSIFQCSSLEEKVDATWIMFSTLGTSSPHQSPEVAEISEILKTILFFFCQHLLLSQNFSSWAKWGLFSLCVLQRLTKQHSTPVFLLPKRAIPLCPVVKVCDVTLDTLVPHQCHKVLWEGGVLELTVMEFLDSHHLSSPFTNRNTSQRGEKKYIERLGIEL